MAADTSDLEVFKDAVLEETKKLMVGRGIPKQIIKEVLTAEFDKGMLGVEEPTAHDGLAVWLKYAIAMTTHSTILALTAQSLAPASDPAIHTTASPDVIGPCTRPQRLAQGKHPASTSTRNEVDGAANSRSMDTFVFEQPNANHSPPQEEKSELTATRSHQRSDSNAPAAIVCACSHCRLRLQPLYDAISILAPLLAEQPKKKTVNDVESLMWLIHRSDGAGAKWVLVVPGHGVCRVSLGGSGFLRGLRVVMCQGDFGDVIRAHLHAHLPTRSLS
jgi:hypothetical protein